MTRLTKYEKETIILFNEGEDRAKIYTYNAGLRKRLATFSKKYPDLCRLEKNCEQGGVTYILDKSRLSIRLQAVYHVKRVVLVNTEIVDEYLENFRDEL